MSTHIRTKIVTAVSCFMSTIAVGSALSSVVQAEELQTKTVRFNDLDLSTTDGAKTLYNRIRAAARTVCTSYETDPILRMAGKACIDKAIDNAVRQVNAPALTNLRFGSSNLLLAQK